MNLGCYTVTLEKSVPKELTESSFIKYVYYI